MWKSEKIEAFLSQKKNIWLLYGIVSICIVLLLFWGSSPRTPEAEVPTSSEKEGTELSSLLTSVLSEIRGVGDVRVAVTYESGPETVHARNLDGTRETVVTLGSGNNEKAVAEKEILPRVRGVIVVADGGGDAAVRRNILAAVEALTGAAAHSIAVFPAK